MQIDLPFQKPGLVTVGTADPTQQINLMNPIGQPLDVCFNLQTSTVSFNIKSWDDRNEVVRYYELPFGVPEWVDFLQLIFDPHVRKSAKENFAEFSGLNQIYSSVTIHGVTIPVTGYTAPI